MRADRSETPGADRAYTIATPAPAGANHAESADATACAHALSQQLTERINGVAALRGLTIEARHVHGQAAAQDLQDALLANVVRAHTLGRRRMRLCTRAFLRMAKLLRRARGITHRPGIVPGRLAGAAA